MIGVIVIIPLGIAMCIIIIGLEEENDTLRKSNNELLEANYRLTKKNHLN